ncbi:MAG: T9SS type A sorting domain-containing protein [Bacteroidetes bacterium]|nr:T9SS type A sorting domain-containing protein [Bacteroidota bacterium]
MKATSTILGLLFSVVSVLAQTPKLYIHIVSHNEPTDNIESSALIFNKFKNNALQMANIINMKDVKWNLQTSDGFILGALQYQSAGTSTTDIFETLSNPPYNDNIEIDPRSKNKNGRNIADQCYLLDSCGANPTTHLGGFIYSTTNPIIRPIDWLQYSEPIIGNIYGNSWQCTIMTGAGSYPPHTNDLHDFGVFKPDTTNNFYSHNPNKNLWCMGKGCAPVLDSLDNEQEIIDLIQGQVDSIQNGLWPQNKFYVTRIMTNQREYGPLFFQKISKVIDSLNLIPSSKLQWATIGETFTAFQAWQTNSGLDHSQWLCGQTTTGVENLETNNKFLIYPNPFSNTVSIDFTDHQEHKIEVFDYLGSLLYSCIINANTTIDLSKFSNGIYLIRIDSRAEKIIKY